MNRIKYQLFVLSLFWCQVAFTQNPIIGDIGISDPHVRVFNDTIYLYSGHDADPDDRTWVMKDWRVFSTTDLINWTLRETISPKDNYMGENSSDCWASDAASRNGKYYFYFSDQKRGIGVMVSDSPAGPFKDPLGKALIAPMHDPTILIDDDPNNTPYIIYGDKEGGGYHIARLNDDMISVAETPKPITIIGEEWEKAPSWMDKNYLFKYDDTYYLSWGPEYAVSKNIYGPYECVGSVGEGHNLNAFAHGSFFWWKGQFYHVWCYYKKNPYFKFRETIITYCHFDDEGKIITDTDFLNNHFSNGVGEYNAAWPKIEAEWYYEISGNIHKTGDKEDGFVLSNIKDRDWIKFANVSFEKEYKKFVANVSLDGNKGSIQIRTDKPDGNLLGEVELSDESDNFQEVVCNLNEIIGKKDVYLLFIGENNTTINLDWFRFED